MRQPVRQEPLDRVAFLSYFMLRNVTTGKIVSVRYKTAQMETSGRCVPLCSAFAFYHSRHLWFPWLSVG